jgi:hypothetical protein
MRLRSLTSIVLALAGAPAALASDNLILNGSFATKLTNWNKGDGAAEWSPESAVADGTGSARLTCDAATAGTACDPLLQCIVVTPGSHLLQLTIRVPAGQATTGDGYAVAYAYSGTICSGAPVAGSFYTDAVAAGVWRTRWIPIDVPAGAASVSVRLTVVKDTAGGSFDVLADAVELRTGLLFVDGFASGTTAQWSATFP